MSDQPKPATGEWTAFGASVKRVGDDDSLFNCSTRTDADVAVRTHNAALDAERETISPEMQPNGGIDRKDKALQEQAQIIAGLHQQLAAGQESRESAEANCDLLATEKHRIHGEVQQLREQLAEEKENCKNAHDAYNLVSDKNRELHRKLAAELENIATLANQLHELRVAFGQAEDWNKITSIEINNIRSLNKEIKEDKLKTELACEQWIRQCEELQQQLAAEREKREKAEQAANHNADISDSIARASQQVEQQLRAQLAAAQAAIAEHNAHVTEMHTASSDDCYEIPMADTTALDAAIAAAQKPLVELLLELRNRINRGRFRNHLEIDKDELETIQQIDAALAKIGKHGTE